MYPYMNILSPKLQIYSPKVGKFQVICYLICIGFSRKCPFEFSEFLKMGTLKIQILNQK